MKIKKRQEGVALLMSLGILAMVIVVAFAFAANICFMESSARNYLYEVQARYVAEAGMAYTIAALKKDARDNFVYSGTPISVSGLPSNMAATVTVKDTAQEININNANENLLECLPDIGTTLAGDIVTYRDADQQFNFITKQSICLVSGIGDGIYDSIKDYITTETYIDPNVLDESGAVEERSAINVNTVDPIVLLPVILDVVTDVGPATAATVISAINSIKPIRSWQSFNSKIDSYSASDISTLAKSNIKAAFNPNRQKPDANYPTEFCFHSGGTYEISVTGQVNVTAGTTTQTVAQKTINTTVKVFDLTNVTKKSQFKYAPSNYDVSNLCKPVGYPLHSRVTWFDSCPVNIATCYANIYRSSSAQFINDSIKIGYWDDFEEDPAYTWGGNANAATSAWRDSSEGYPATISGGTFHCETDSTLPVVHPWMTLGLRGTDIWQWEYFTARVYLRNSTHNINGGHRKTPSNADRFYDVGAHLVLLEKNGINYAMQADIFIGEADPESVKPPHPMPGHENFYTDFVYFFITNTAWGNTSHGDPLSLYYTEKTFVATVSGDGATDYCTAAAYDSSGSLITNASYSVGPYLHTDLGNYNGRGTIAIYAGKSDFWADNMRIIGQTGYYQSMGNVLSPSTVEFGAIWGTETLPGAAVSTSEKVAFQVSEDGSNWYPSVSQYSDIDSQLQPEGGSINSTLASTSGGNTGTLLYYKANFVTRYGDSSNTTYTETPVLEDVWITYLPATKILYYKEN